MTQNGQKAPKSGKKVPRAEFQNGTGLSTFSPPAWYSLVGVRQLNQASDGEGAWHDKCSPPSGSYEGAGAERQVVYAGTVLRMRTHPKRAQVGRRRAHPCPRRTGEPRLLPTVRRGSVRGDSQGAQTPGLRTRACTDRVTLFRAYISGTGIPFRRRVLFNLRKPACLTPTRAAQSLPAVLLSRSSRSLHPIQCAPAPPGTVHVQE